MKEVFFLSFDEILPKKFDLKNMILTDTKDFPWKKLAQNRQISKNK